MSKVIDKDLLQSPVSGFKDAPTGTETDRTRYIVSTTPTVAGDFEGLENKVVTKLNGNWHITEPKLNIKFLNESDGLEYKWNGTAWVVGGQESKKTEEVDVAISTDTLKNEITLGFTPVGDIGVVKFGFLDATGKFIEDTQYAPVSLVSTDFAGKVGSWTKTITTIPTGLKAQVEYITSGN